ncbi:MAG: carboxypeptidase-like regulatory domain-containing protein [Candidatus Acidiferrales bacterium]
MGFLLAAIAATAGTVTGTVRNGTTNTPAANVEMILIQLQGGMQPVANTRTDAEGHYEFNNPVLGTAPMLLRAVYKGVNYHEPVTAGKTNVDVQVFEPTDKQDAVAVTVHAIILQPDGVDLDVGEEYNIQNKTQPPLAYYRSDGDFLFSLPAGAQMNQVSAVSAAGMPVIQSTIDKGNGEQAITYPFRPGDSGVRMSYKIPYPGNETKLSFVSHYVAERLGIFVPPGVQVTGDGLSPAGQEQGFNVFMHQTVAANTPFSISVSGTAPPPPQGGQGSGAGSAGGPSGGDDSQDPSVNSRADSPAAAPTVTATTLPARLDSLKWILVAGFAALFALGLVFVWRRPEAAMAGGIDSAPGAVAVAAPQVSSASPVSAAAHVNREVQGSVEEMKETLFRLELRRQAGTIAEEEYVREHARIQKLLHDLVKG